MPANPISIRISGRYCSISDLEWIDVPPLAVITGVNGAGKSQLLEVIALKFGALTPRNPRMGPPRVDAQVQIGGADFKRGEVFHTYGEWAQVGAGAATEQGIKEAIQNLRTNHNNPWFWTTFADQLGVAMEEAQALPLEEFYENLTPGLLWGNQLPSGAHSLSFLFLAYRLFEKDALARGKSKEDVLRLFGEPPWHLMNEILETSGLPFRVNEPDAIRPFSLVYANSFVLRLRDLERKQDVPFESLSSGEKVIMSTALWRYGAEHVGRHYQLLLLDEPDAHLHPSLTRRFLDVIERVFVEERGVRVIMTTHSPSTVALTPADSLFEMRRTAPRINRAEKREAIAVLTDGFVAVHEATQTVLLEGRDDPAFYQLVWDLLTERSAISEPGPLQHVPTLSFIYGQGKDNVKQLVPQIRGSGLLNFHGIIDRDEGNAPSDGVHVLGRNGMENYLLDPVNVWLLLHMEDQAPAVEGVQVPKGRAAYMRGLTDGDLQAIADSILAQMEPTLTGLSAAERSRTEISFAGGRRLRYPNWLLYRDDKEIYEQFRRTFGHRLLTQAKLLRSYATLNLIPEDLLHLYRAIQLSGKPTRP